MYVNTYPVFYLLNRNEYGFSPHINGNHYAFQVSSAGAVGSFNWGVADSGGIYFIRKSNFALRTSAVSATRIMCTRMVASTTTTTVCIGIPAGGKSTLRCSMLMVRVVYTMLVTLISLVITISIPAG